MELNKDFKEFVKLLNENGVKYLTIGGYAVAYHGYPRYTKDIDFWIFSTPENTKKILKTIVDFGFGGMGIEEADFNNPDNITDLCIICRNFYI